MKKEGEIFKEYLDKQKVSKVLIAKELGMSRSNLYQLFNSEQLEVRTKKKINKFLGTSLFKLSGWQDATTQKSGFLRFLAAFPNLFKDKPYPDVVKERIKKVMHDLLAMYQLEEIYKRMGIPTLDGSETFLGVISPDKFIDLLDKTFNINRAYLLNGEWPIHFLRDETFGNSYASTVTEGENGIISTLKEVIELQKTIIESQKTTIQSQQDLIESLKSKNS